MEHKSTLNIKLIVQVLFVYHLFSTTVGIFVLSPALYLGMKNSQVSQVVSILVVIVLYVPFLWVTYGFMKLKRWPYFLILLFYVMEVFEAPPLFNFKLSFFHRSLALTFKGLEFGIDFISLSILIFLISIGREYLTHTRPATKPDAVQTNKRMCQAR